MKHQKNNETNLTPKHIAIAVAVAFAALSTNAFASGYQFGSQTVSGQGNSDAGSAEADNASTIFYNPAGMSRLKGDQFTIGTTIVVPHSTYTDQGSTDFTGTSTGGTAASGYAPSSVVAPNTYISHQIDDKLNVGLGIFVPYGAQLNYGNTWTGRYALTDVKLQSMALNPSLSFKLDSHNSFGFGITAEYMKAKLDQAVDVPGSLKALNIPISAGDGEAGITGHGWGYGFNLGYLYQVDDNTRFGLAYRSSIKQTLKGNATWDFSTCTTNPAINSLLAAGSGHANSASELDLNTPETLSANVFSQLNDTWAVMADVTWTRNSRLTNLNIQFPGTAEGDETIRQEWKNTYRLSLGANYRVNQALTLRTGIAFDQAPVTSPQLTDPALPDSNRHWFSAGLNYKIDAHSSIDAAYSYVAFKDALVDYTNGCSPIMTTCTGNGETTLGKYSTDIQFVGVSYNYMF
ncbi:MAG TPA: OmpP1/FadL family transporter [Burkholderiaceae bacterium]|nr:OmpP1/FadL family transporter [Burkholderiaceae bacterium]